MGEPSHDSIEVSRCRIEFSTVMRVKHPRDQNHIETL